MKKGKWVLFALFLLVLSIFSFEFKTADRSPLDESSATIQNGKSVFAAGSKDVVPLSRLMDREIAAGNLRPALTQADELEGYVHQRYDVYYQGVKVWGDQLIRHLKDRDIYCINGSYHNDINISVTPALNKEQAVAITQNDLHQAGFILAGDPELVIFPGDKAYLLAYKVGLLNLDQYWVSFVNAQTGEVFFKYNNIQREAAVGIGRGTLGDLKKLSTEHKENKYYLNDVMRPAKLITGNMYNSEDTGTTYYITDSDNDWPDPVAVDAHGYLGWIYDYYYLAHNRKGMNNANMNQVISIHYGSNYSNAFYNPDTTWMYFGDGDPSQQYPYATALDIVTHEFTHGVTDHTCALIYAFESGALNEAISDIMGVSCEFFHQPAGYGYQKAEWWEGEDIKIPFGPGRSLADPSSIPLWSGASYYYPDHYAKRYILSMDTDNGGVHINSSIASHWYYLLANGGTNRTSGIYVSGIGVSKAEKIAYRGWFYYLHPSATHASARSATYQAAVDLYGASSTEALRVAQAWNAVGVS